MSDLGQEELTRRMLAVSWPGWPETCNVMYVNDALAVATQWVEECTAEIETLLDLEEEDADADYRRSCVPCTTCGIGTVHPLTPRWDQDRLVIESGWVEGRCGECGNLEGQTQLDALRAELAALRQENEALQETQSRLETLHRPGDDDPAWCNACTFAFPCATGRILSASALPGVSDLNPNDAETKP